MKNGNPSADVVAAAATDGTFQEAVGVPLVRVDTHTAGSQRQGGKAPESEGSQAQQVAEGIQDADANGQTGQAAKGKTEGLEASATDAREKHKKAEEAADAGQSHIKAGESKQSHDDPGCGTGQDSRPAEAATKAKRRGVCAAANDDEDLGVLFTVKSQDSKERKVAVKEPSAEHRVTSKREKAFAWMDSDDDGEQEDIGDADQNAEDGDADEGDAEATLVTTDALDEVHSFGRMMLLAPALRTWLQQSTTGPAEVMAVCRALARTKFFDGDILEDLHVVLQKLLQAGSLDFSQTDDAIQCFRSLNAYDRGFFSAVARAFKGRVHEIPPNIRNSWSEAYKGFGHSAERDFLQLLEIPPLLANNPSFRRVRCWHFSKGSCHLESLCTFSHDPRAPLSLADGGNEDWWRSKPLVMTQTQKTMGHGVYGLSNTSDMRAPPVAPAGWLMAPQGPQGPQVPQGLV